MTSLSSRWLIVADDLTGAIDAAAPFADSGWCSQVLMQAPQEVAPDLSVDRPRETHRVLALDTHTRDGSTSEAAATVARAMSLSGVTPGWMPFKKVDSTLRGHVGVETLAALKSCGRRLAIVCPAAPAQGRVVRAGKLFIHGREAEGADMVQGLRQQLPGVRIGRWDRHAPSSSADGILRILVADAESDTDLDLIAKTALPAYDDCLLVGSFGLAAAIARLVGQGGEPQVRASEASTEDRLRGEDRYERIVFVVGSQHAVTCAQVDVLLKRWHTHIRIVDALAASELDGASEKSAPLQVTRGSAPDLVLIRPAASTRVQRGAQEVATELARVATQVIRAEGARPTLLVMTGGDTARATLRELGISKIAVLGSLWPGVPWAQGHGAALKQLGLLSKSGGFGHRELLCDVVDRLMIGSPGR